MTPEVNEYDERPSVCENAALMNGRSRSLALVSLLVLAAPIHAHDTWIAPAEYRATAAGPVTLSLSSGMGFPELDHAIATDRVAAAKWRSVQGSGDLSSPSPGAHALQWEAKAGEGVTQFSVVLHPRPSKLKREQVREYIDHLGIPNADAVFAEWQRTSKSEETAYRYMKYAKTFVRAGAAAASSEWATPAGMRLELVPQSDPTSLEAGGTLDVVLLDRGKPLARYPVAMLCEWAKDPIGATTDAGGRVRIALPSSGRCMLRATVLGPSEDKAAAWDVHFTTMTFDVEAKR